MAMLVVVLQRGCIHTVQYTSSRGFAMFGDVCEEGKEKERELGRRTMSDEEI